MTPVLAIPTLGRPHLRECIESIDTPVRLLLIANGNIGFDIPGIDMPHPHITDAWLLEPPNNLGVAASMNLAIKCYPTEPFWLIANDDVVFAPGDLQRLIDSDEYGWTGINDWSAMKVTAEVIETVGWWDEDFAPAYCEDADYERRCDLAGVRWGFITGDTTHARSACLRDHRDDNARTYPRNVAHHVDKWGVGVRGVGGYATPYDQGVRMACGPSLRRLREAVWRPDR